MPEAASAWPDDLKRLLERMAEAGMAPDMANMDLSEQRAVYRALCRRLAMPQPQPTQEVKDEAE